MATPRVLLLTGAIDDPRVLSWVPLSLSTEPRAQLAGSTWFAWRLLSGNNRELGRSAQLMSSQDDSLADVERAMTAIATAMIETRRSASYGTYGWIARDHDRPIALSGKSFARLRDAENAASQFIEALPLATVATLAGVPTTPALSTADAAVDLRMGQVRA
jgi:hypothetical protein